MGGPPIILLFCCYLPVYLHKPTHVRHAYGNTSRMHIQLASQIITWRTTSMNDLRHAATFFLIFAISLVLYGALLAKTGNKGLLPARASHSVRGPQDVRRVGSVTMAVGAVVGALALAVRLLAG